MNDHVRKSLRLNVPLLYIFRILSNAAFLAPIIVIFLKANGLSFTEVMVLQAIFSGGLIVLEVPSGFFADILGRKITLVIGSFILTGGAALYSVGTSFAEFAAAELLWATAASLLSGCDTAMLYDTLAAEDRPDEYKRTEGNIYSAVLGSSVIATVIGGFAAAAYLRLPFYLTVATFALLIPASFLFREPPRVIGGHERGRLYYFYKIHRFALYKNREVRWLILFGATVSALSIVHFWLYQPYLKLCGVGLAYFGLIFGLFNLFAAASSKQASWLERRLGRTASVAVMPSALGASAFLSAAFVTPFSFLFILPAQFVRGFSAPVLNDYLNRLVWSDKRATVASIRNLLGRLLFVFVSPAIGAVADAYGVLAALTVTGAIIVLFGGALVVVMRKARVI